MTDATTAEMVKLMENTYRDINIAIANEFSRLTNRFGVNVWEAIKLANRHPRVNILKPGPGVGGHCISVDPWFLVEAAPDLSKLIHTARQVNDEQPSFVVDLLQREMGSLQGKRISILGLTYKPNVDDIRESPAIKVVHLLQSAGAIITAFDPYTHFADLERITLSSTLEGALKNADIIILLVAHSEFLELTPNKLARLTTARILFDTNNALSQFDWAKAGFKYIRLGVG